MRKQDERENRIQGKSAAAAEGSPEADTDGGGLHLFSDTVDDCRGSLGRKPLVSACQPAGVGGDHGALFPDL